MGAYSALPEWGPSSDPVPAVPGVHAVDRFHGVSGPAVDLIARTARGPTTRRVR